jgi:hypothetical protein
MYWKYLDCKMIKAKPLPVLKQGAALLGLRAEAVDAAPATYWDA